MKREPPRRQGRPPRKGLDRTCALVQHGFTMFNASFNLLSLGLLLSGAGEV